MATDTEFSDDKLEAFIQACLSEQDVPEADLKTLENLMATQSSKAQKIAMRLLDESMIRSWFRSQADTSFINEVQRRLDLRFQDQEFIQAVMHRVKNNVDSAEGTPGATLHKDSVKSVSMLRYILVPFCAALLYIGLVHNEALMEFFSDSERFMLTVEAYEGKPEIISAGKNQHAILKMIIRPGDTLNTDKLESLILKYPDESLLQIPEHSSFVIVNSQTQKSLQLLRGTIHAIIKKQNEQTPFVIKTSFGDVNLIHGELSIEIKDDSLTIKALKNSVDFYHAVSNQTIKIRQQQTVLVNNHGTEILEQ